MFYRNKLPLFFEKLSADKILMILTGRTRRKKNIVCLKNKK